VAVALLFASLVSGVPAPVRAAGPATSGPSFVNISATTAFSFTPDSFTVAPGASVHLIVTQLANFNHTFTLSSAVNVTIPASSSAAQLGAFFQAHPPLVNLSLGPTVEKQYSVEFTAPTVQGAYEYVCLIHFPSMVGTMTVSSSPSTTGSGASLSPLELVGIGGAAAVLVIAGVASLWIRSRRKRSAGRAGPPVS
jgi:plastocyanin